MLIKALPIEIRKWYKPIAPGIWVPCELADAMRVVWGRIPKPFQEMLLTFWGHQALPAPSFEFNPLDMDSLAHYHEGFKRFRFHPCAKRLSAEALRGLVAHELAHGCIDMLEQEYSKTYLAELAEMMEAWGTIYGLEAMDKTEDTANFLAVRIWGFGAEIKALLAEGPLVFKQ